MNKTAIKNFAIWARNKLIADITYKAGLLGITEKDIKSPLPQSTQSVQFFDIGTKEPSSITGHEIEQRKKLVEEIQRKANQSDYSTAYKNVIEEVGYTWFNRLIAIRFMEVNDYLPSRIRVLSSESNGKAEPDLVTHALEANLDYSAYERDRIMQLKHENKLDELFRMLFIKQCNALNTNLPELFEKTSDYTELLLNVSITDKNSIVYHLTNDIPEDDFNVAKEGQVEIIGWLYQYYNTEPKDETFALLKKNVKITKERIPAATQLFTPDWIVRYMVENSLGRLWFEGHPNDELKSNWKYYLDEAEREEGSHEQLNKICEEYKFIKPEDIKFIDPAMGSGHILVYAFDVLMQIYKSHGYSQRDAAKSIVEKNLYGLDIDNRAYQLSYFAVMMKARQYNRKILGEKTRCNVYAIQESNDINRNHLKYFGSKLNNKEQSTAITQINSLLDVFTDAKEYGSILIVENFNWDLLRKFTKDIDIDGQMSLDSIGVEYTRNQMNRLVEIGEVMASKYDVVVTNPPYMGKKSLNTKLSSFMDKYYQSGKSELYSTFIIMCVELTKTNGFTAMVTIHTWMFISSFENLRNYLLDNVNITSMVHTGAATFEELNSFNVLATTFSLRKTHSKSTNSLFVRLADYYNTSEKIVNFNNYSNYHWLDQSEFKTIPGSPFVYWASDVVRNVFKISKTIRHYSEPKQGMATADNDKFVRYWFEVSNNTLCLKASSNEDAIESKAKWFPYNKGGKFRKWYGMNEYVVNWYLGGMELKGFNSAVLRNQSYYFKNGITWSLFGFENFGVRYKDSGYLFDVSGSSMFPDSKIMNYLLAFLASKVAFMYLSLLAPTVNFQVGNIGDLPLIIDNNHKEEIEDLAKQCVNISREEWDDFEESWDFVKHPFLKYQTSNNLNSVYNTWKNHSRDRYEILKNNEERINQLFIAIYNLHNDLTPQVVQRDIAIRIAEEYRDIRSFISYAVGCMFGRYSLDMDGTAYAGGEWDTTKFSKYHPDIDNILPITDEEYFQDDIVGRFIEFVGVIYGLETLEVNLDFIAKALGAKGTSSREIIRKYFMKDFFGDHYKIYQKRPIYWLFDSGKNNGFKALIYMHRYDENTIGNLRIDYLHRMQRIYENEIARMQDTVENSRDTREVSLATQRKEKMIKQLQETKKYDEKIAHLALARISIDLDDGVKVNYEKVQTDTDGNKISVLATI